MLEKQQQIWPAGERDKESVRNQLSSELQVRRNCFERSLHERNASHVQAFHLRRVAGQHEAELSVRLQQGESLITSMTESFEESGDGLRALADPPPPPRASDTSTAGIVKSNRFRKNGRKKPNDSQRKWPILRRTHQQEGTPCRSWSRHQTGLRYHVAPHRKRGFRAYTCSDCSFGDRFCA